MPEQGRARDWGQNIQGLLAATWRKTHQAQEWAGRQERIQGLGLMWSICQTTRLNWDRNNEALTASRDCRGSLKVWSQVTWWHLGEKSRGTSTPSPRACRWLGGALGQENWAMTVGSPFHPGSVVSFCYYVTHVNLEASDVWRCPSPTAESLAWVPGSGPHIPAACQRGL